MAEEKTDLRSIPYGMRLWLLFWSYVKITALVVGGGYAIISASEEYVVRRKRWLSEDEMLDVIAVTQTVPGILACNSAICVGLRVAGFAGAVAALAGSMLPSIVAIVLIAFVLRDQRSLLESRWMRGAFTGVIAGVVGMLLNMLVRMGKKVLNGAFEYAIAIGGFVAMCVFDLNPALIVVAAIPCGVLYVWSKSRRLRT